MVQETTRKVEKRKTKSFTRTVWEENRKSQYQSMQKKTNIIKEAAV
jgi:hypothetical protein